MALPPGLILNPQTGELTGTPTTPGTYVVVLRVRDALGNSRLVTDTIVINAYTPMTWSGTFANLMATRAISGNTLALTGGLAAITYSIAAGALPAGLSLNTSTGAITGTPTTPGAFSFTLRATDALAQTKDKVVTGTVATNLTLAMGATLQGHVSRALTRDGTQAGGTAPFTYDLSSGALPTGTTFAANGGVGRISGTPAATYNAAPTFRVTDAYGFTATSSITLTINALPTVSGGNFVRWMAGKAGYARTFTASGGFTSYTWAATGLPPGLTMNASTGEVTGTPTTAGSYSAYVTVTDALGVAASNTATLVEIAPALTVSGSYATSATRNVVYPTFTPAAAGGYAPRTFDISAGALPPGLSLNAGNGVISGTPSAQGSYTATLRVTDADGSTATMAFNVDVAGDMSMTGSVPTRGTLTVAFAGDNLGVSGGAAAYIWSIQSGALPTGLSLNTSTGDISGTPTATGTFNYTIRVTDSSSGWVQASFTTTVAAYPTLSGDLPDATNGLAYDHALARIGGHAPFTYDLSSGALPTGLSLNTGTGAIAGTPTVNGASSFTLRVTDNAGNVATKADSITVYAPPAISGTVGNQAELTVAYSDSSMSVTGGKPTVAWSLAGGSLPPGLTLNGGTGAITGTPTTAGTYSFYLRAVDALGVNSDSYQTIVVRAKVGITSGPVTAATRTIAYSGGGSVAGNGWTAYTWSISAGALPPGLSISAATGTISGTPTANGYYSFTIRVVDALGAAASNATFINVAAPVALTEALNDATVGVSYDDSDLAVSGGWGPYAYSVVSGALPAGLSLGMLGQNGRLYGTPTTAGTYNFNVRVTDNGQGGGSYADVACDVVVYNPPSLSLSYPRGTVSQSYSGTASTSGGKAPLSYALVAGALPNGLSLNSSTGALTGTCSVAGTYYVQIRVTDALGNTSDVSGYQIVVAAALGIPGAFANAQQNTAYSSQVTATGGWPNYSFSHVGGTLPAGLSLAANGTMSGTPTTAATYNFTVRVTDGDSHTFDKAMQVIVEAPAFNVTITPNPGYDQAFSGGSSVTALEQCTASVTGAVGTVSYSWTKIVAGSLAAFTASGTNTATLTVQHSSRFDYDSTETWRVTATTSTGQSDTADVPITLLISGGV